MRTRSRASKKAPQNSFAPTVQNQFSSRSFGIQAQTEATPTSETEKPDLQAAAERAKNFGHNITNISFESRSTFAPAPIQPKLTIGKPGDQYEQEADRVASQVVSQINTPSKPPLQRRSLEEIESLTQPQTPRPMGKPLQRRSLVENLQRQEAPEEEEEAQMKPISRLIQSREAIGGGAATPNLESSIQSARGGGQPLADTIRQPMEQAFGANFSGVKVHTDSQSDQLNKSIQAKAFTTGQDVFFRQGEYNPGSKDGQELIAHELTHTIQQGAAPALQTKLQSSPSLAVSPAAGLTNVPKVQLAGGGTGGPRGGSGTVQAPGKHAQQPSQEKTESEKRVGNEAEEKSSKTTQVGEGNVTTTKTSQSIFLGAEAALKTVSEASDDTLKKSVEALARAGVFGEAARKKTLETTSGIKGTAKGNASGMGGAESKASAEVELTIEGLTVLLKASARAGFGGDLAGALTVAYGPVAAQLKSKISGFAGVWAEAKGSLNLSRTAIILEGSAKAGAGSTSSGKVSLQVSAASLGIKGAGNYEALAGAEAGVEGKLSLSLFGIEGSGKAEAFAGAKVKVGAASSLTYKGTVLVKISGEAEAAAGIGGEVEGQFSYANGKLTVGGSLAVALGIGGGGGAEIEVDFAEIGNAITSIVVSAFTDKVLDNRARGDKNRPSMPSAEARNKMQNDLINAVVPYLKAYVSKQAKGGRGVKREDFQTIIDEKLRSVEKYQKLLMYLESDRAMRAIIRMSLENENLRVDVQEGVIRQFGVAAAEKDIKSLF